jgi:hypothetical protein
MQWCVERKCDWLLAQVPVYHNDTIRAGSHDSSPRKPFWTKQLCISVCSQHSLGCSGFSHAILSPTKGLSSQPCGTGASNELVDRVTYEAQHRWCGDLQCQHSLASRIDVISRPSKTRAYRSVHNVGYMLHDHLDRHC